MRQIKYYKTATGNYPVRDFLDSLSAKQAQKVKWVLGLIEELERIPSQYFKKLVSTDDIGSSCAIRRQHIQIVKFF